MSSPYAEYRKIIGAAEHDRIARLAGYLKGQSVVMVNSTRDGGGVAEILRNMVPMLNELGVETTWEVIEGRPDFFAATKTLHNALHGRPEPLTPAMQKAYWEVTDLNAEKLRSQLDKPLVFIHDPQPGGLLQKLKKPGQKWVYRCHVDVSTPYPPVWKFLSSIMEEYDASVFSHPSFAQKMPKPQFLIAPSIDPLSDKNKPLPESFVRRTLERYHLDPARPLITQVSRFDKLKDPLGVIQAFRLVKKTHPSVQLLLAGGAASDDPESAHILPAIQEAAGQDESIHILDLPPFSDLEINALQRASTVVLQKSLKEGFALTVSEALWKERPVVAMAVGGIPLQVLSGKTGYLVHTIEGTAVAIRHVLDHPAEAAALARNGREHVRQNFLITRHTRDYMSLFLSVMNPHQTVVALGPSQAA
ncbi:MAG TPA: glycosyltransferase [bacterium]|nr:glycosyltransferase [bacterium]